MMGYNGTTLVDGPRSSTRVTVSWVVGFQVIVYGSPAGTCSLRPGFSIGLPPGSPTFRACQYVAQIKVGGSRPTGVVYALATARVAVKTDRSLANIVLMEWKGPNLLEV
jgi:hypothetical protein